MKFVRMLLLPGLIAGAFALAACQTTSDSSSPPSVSNVQTAVKTTCGFVATAASLAQLLTTSGAVKTASDWAHTICAAVTNVPLSDGPSGKEPLKVVVNGVRIHGTYADGRRL